MNAPPPSASGPWSRLYAALFGIASGVAAAYGGAVMLLGAPGAFGYGIDIAAGLAGLAGVALTGLDLCRDSRTLGQRLRRPALAKGLPSLLGLVLAAVSGVMALFLGLMALLPIGTGLRILFAAIALYLAAIALELHDESGR